MTSKAFYGKVIDNYVYVYFCFLSDERTGIAAHHGFKAGAGFYGVIKGILRNPFAYGF